MKRFRVSVGVAAIVFLLAAASAWAAERFPPPDFESGYAQPQMQQPLARSNLLEFLDVAALVVSLSLATSIGLRARNRRAMVALSLFSLAYFGFYRSGCVCPIGAIQNVALALADPGYVVPLTVMSISLATSRSVRPVKCTRTAPKVQPVVLLYRSSV